MAALLVGAPRLAQAADLAGELAVSVDQGSLEIIDAPGTNIAVEVFRVTDGRATPVKEAAADCKLRRDDAGLVLKLSSRGRAGLVFRVHVPAKMTLNLKSSHGGILIPNHDGPVNAQASVGLIQLGQMRGEVDARSSGSDVRLQRGDAAVRVKTSGGRMDIGEIRGDAVLESSGGAIKTGPIHGGLIAKASGGAIHIGGARNAARIQTSGGSITLNFSEQPQGESVLHASGGAVTLRVPPQLNLRLAVRGEGEINTDLPIDWRDTYERYQRGLLNTNGATVTVRAEGGRVSILSLGERAAAPVQLKPLITQVAGDSTPLILLPPPPAAPPRREAKAAAKDIPRIERDEKIWQHAEWKPIVLLPRGVLLRDGTWIEAEITALSDFQVGFTKADGTAASAKLNQVAAIVLQPVPDTYKAQIESDRRGVLLRKGDFLEGDFSRLDLEQVTLSSVLFGLKKFSPKTEVGALVLRGQ